MTSDLNREEFMRLAADLSTPALESLLEYHQQRVNTSFEILVIQAEIGGPVVESYMNEIRSSELRIPVLQAELDKRRGSDE